MKVSTGRGNDELDTHEVTFNGRRNKVSMGSGDDILVPDPSGISGQFDTIILDGKQGQDALSTFGVAFPDGVIVRNFEIIT